VAKRTRGRQSTPEGQQQGDDQEQTGGGFHDGAIIDSAIRKTSGPRVPGPRNLRALVHRTQAISRPDPGRARGGTRTATPRLCEASNDARARAARERIIWKSNGRKSIPVAQAVLERCPACHSREEVNR
jgi:hypothetical protein